ncbi:MAG: NHL repeat-containing protein [bacterium]|jgi:tripartite motif-containing protein 71
MRVSRLFIGLLVVFVVAGCGMLSAKKGGSNVNLPPSSAPLDSEGYGELQLLATISGDFMPSPSGVAVNSDGHVYVTDDVRQMVLVFSADDFTTLAKEIGGEGSGLGQFVHPREITIDKEGNLYVLDDGNSRVQKLSPAGESIAVFGRREDFSTYFSLQDGYDEPLSALAVDGDGNVYVGISGANYDISPHALVKFSSDGGKLWEVKSTLEGEIDLLPFAWPDGMTVGSDGTMYIAHGANGVGKILVLPQRDGQPTKDGAAHFAPIGKGQGELMHTPGGIALTPDCDLLVADTYNNRLQLFSTDGTLKAMYRLKGLSTEFDQPTALAVAADGSVFVVDSGNKRVLKLRLIPPADVTISG